MSVIDEAQITGDLNKLSDQIVDLVKGAITGLRVDQALIVNDTRAPVTFYVYNYADSVYWVSAMKAKIAPQKSGMVAASGVFFKIHPNDDKSNEFLVAPGKAYVYRGAGDVSVLGKG